MSEMVERVADAISEATIPVVRTNKAREDGLIYEVVYCPTNVAISEETLKVAGAFADERAALAVRDQLERTFVGRAAIEAMREPTEALTTAGSGAALKYGLVLPGGSPPYRKLADSVYREMIDAALKEPANLRS